MNHLNRVLLVLCSVSIMSSCTVNVIQMGGERQLSDLPSLTDNLKEPVSDPALCHRFIFPEVDPPPTFPEIPLAKRQDDDYVLDQLVSYNQEVREYLKNAERIVMGAYEEYLQSCQ